MNFICKVILWIINYKKMFEEVDERERKMPIMFEKDKFGK